MGLKLISKGALERTGGSSAPVHAESGSTGHSFHGFPALLLILAVVSVTLISFATASIALADMRLADSSTPTVPLILPGGASVSGADRDGKSTSGATAEDLASPVWIVGGQPGRATARIAARHLARPVVAGLGIYRISRGKAADFARRLDRSGLLVYAEPDVPTTPAGYPGDLLATEQWWLNRVVSPNDVTPPAVTGNSPLIGLIERGVDPEHPDLLKANLYGATKVDSETDSHGTAIAGIIGSPGEGAGIRGVWPGARMRQFPAGANCTTASDAVVKAVRNGASVINMSYTIPASLCYSHYLATQFAVSRNVLPVAAAGNSGDSGNGAMRPAVDPHVISVSAVDADGLVAAFATRNSGVDITAPGVKVFAPIVNTTLNGEGIRRAVYTWGGVSGTSFSAPIVSAAAAWIRQARPYLTARQVARVLTSGATDLGLPGRDPDYGEGLLDIEASLNARRPYNDPREPNDDISLLKGVGHIKKARYLWKPKGRRVVKLRATVSRSKDPADVYKVRIPAKKRILVTAVQLDGDVRITALKPSTKTLAKTKRKVIVTSDRPFPKTEGIRVRNLRRKAKDIWIVVTPGSTGTGEHAAYRLTVRRG